MQSQEAQRAAEVEAQARAIADQATAVAAEAQARAAQALQEAARNLNVQLPANMSPAEQYRALQGVRRELRDQLEELQEHREDLIEQLMQERNVRPEGVPGIERQLTAVDNQVIALSSELEALNSQIARVAGIPGAVQRQPEVIQSFNGPPDEVIAMGFVFILAVLMPISIAYARRIWRRSAATVAAIPDELRERLDKLTQSMDAMSVEVERIGEGQRFITRLMSETKEHAEITDGTR